MKFLRTMFAGCLLLLLNSAVVANAQEDKNESIKPAQQDEAKPGTANPQEPMPKQEEKREERNTQGKDREKPAREPNTQQNDENRNPRNAQGKEQNEQKEQNHAAVRGDERSKSRASQRIPDEKFRANFGREHHFRVSQPVVVEGRPRFQYSGYWFEFIDTWPATWSYSDDCYIDYIDGQYFLINLLHPDVRLAVVVVL
ncbi:MAG: hypothetical protein DMG80_18865 [Acidobacteria bacterium]|nr:MAG: hypothetical protein DMG80_18865 [Acidobacteriota bacterium]